ncbi:hypothetical protein AURANDRAFT_67925 [Aureococcus anophagefferens]|uniref:Helicase ATP-binding domain-containing protein n=1 Tax=Aureococcus anophagefferens TaxID=44056 RepID=F0YMW6_AURAN|nr:hypothetical protein AURANDRAFT_67925 [Aureococcus anophagefferens]EGB03551.1 hypothetical protein AURANDRAFT_67925 [Aureococcus anophagefferens]|eukprot:XP_009041766.1 hypothetical protein AURANDRAFT_67925 [Aureococcus anophagefferens]
MVEAAAAAHALKPHQSEGVAFVLARRAAILGDAPSMGKTAQTIAVIAAVLGGGAAATRVLVVAPATVVPVWLAEFRKFLGTEAPAIVTADGDSRALSVAEVLQRLATTSAPLVAVIGYEAMVRHANAFTAMLDLIVFDEAHRLKNPGTKQSTVANDLSELHTLLLLLDPATLPYDLLARIDQGRVVGASPGRAFIAERAWSWLQNTLGGLHLRRETQALALPPQTTYIVVVELTPAEKQLYDHVCERAAPRGGTATAKALVLVGALQKLCSKKLFRGTTHEHDFVIWHDALSAWWEDEAQDYLATLGFKDRQVCALDDTNAEFARYSHGLVGDSPELMPLDAHLFSDLSQELWRHVAITSNLPESDPRRFSTGTPAEMERSVAKGVAVQDIYFRSGRRYRAANDARDLEHKPRKRQRKATCMEAKPLGLSPPWGISAGTPEKRKLRISFP